MECRLLAELAANGGRVLTYGHLLELVWGERGKSDLRPMRTIVGKLRRELEDNADRIPSETAIDYPESEREHEGFETPDQVRRFL